MKIPPIIVLIIGAVGGYLIGSHEPAIDPEVEGGDHEIHLHEKQNVVGVPPQVKLEVYEVGENEFVAEVITTNFILAPLSVSSEAKQGEGHAHIYVDGLKLNRVLDRFYNLGKLEVGEHEISVRLSSNDHKELAVDDVVISDSKVVTVETPSDDHSHEDESESHSHE